MNHLIIFSRYPVPGNTKTRLIPALGAEGAATLHRKMAERMVHQGRLLRNRLNQNLTLHLYFTGGSLKQLQTWLGRDLDYQPQTEGSLGDRLKAALKDFFPLSSPTTPRSVVIQPVIIIGTDCPGISANLLARSFQALQDTDLVIGPALDGGYYLIGLKQYHPELFEGITWSSDRVFQETIAIAQAQDLSWLALDPLPDIDRPEDLPYLPPDLQT